MCLLLQTAWQGLLSYGASEESVAKLEAQVMEAFETSSFMPLPLSLRSGCDEQCAIGSRHNDALDMIES